MKIRNIGPVSSFSTQYGSMKKYALQFEGSDDWVNLNQKETSPAPTVGQELEGTIEDTQYGKQFKRVQSAGGFGGPRNDPATRTSIEAQSSLAQAVAAVAAYHGMKVTDITELSLSAYITQVVNVAKTFAKVVAGENIEVTETKGLAKPVEVRETVSIDDIDLEEPF